MYYTNEDFERFYLKYKSEGITANETMQSFCDRNKVPFNLFHKWYKDTRVRLVPVQVEDRPRQPHPQPDTAAAENKVMIVSADIKASNGMNIHQENVTLDQLSRLVTNLSALW